MVSLNFRRSSGINIIKDCLKISFLAIKIPAFSGPFEIDEKLFDWIILFRRKFDRERLIDYLNVLHQEASLHLYNAVLLRPRPRQQVGYCLLVIFIGGQCNLVYIIGIYLLFCNLYCTVLYCTVLYCTMSGSAPHSSLCPWLWRDTLPSHDLCNSTKNESGRVVVFFFSFQKQLNWSDKVILYTESMISM